MEAQYACGRRGSLCRVEVGLRECLTMKEAKDSAVALLNQGKP